jgi:predicted nucleic acid-binding protein
MGTLKMSGCAYAEFFAGPNRPAVEVLRFLREAEIEIAWEVGEGTWRLAAERFSVYAARRRENGNEPKRFVADFLIGAQAVLDGGRLLTFDRRTYAKAFPELTLVGTDAVQPHN